jgi:hypothetical protein
MRIYPHFLSTPVMHHAKITISSRDIFKDTGCTLFWFRLIPGSSLSTVLELADGEYESATRNAVYASCS